MQQQTIRARHETQVHRDLKSIHSPLCYFMDDNSRGFGLSLGLARGLQVRVGSQSLTQEGMGIGTAAVKRKGLMYFCREVFHEPGECNSVFSVDTVLFASMGPVFFKGLTRFWNSITGTFQRLPTAQRLLLMCAGAIRRLFCVKNHFESVSPKGVILFDYRVHDSGVDVRCVIRDIEVGSTVCLMNELGADWFGKGWREGRVTDPPPSWQALTDQKSIPALYSENLKLLFSIRDIAVTGSSSWKLFWGREKSDSLCWAGYTIEVITETPSVQEIICTYTICLTSQSDEAAIQ